MTDESGNKPRASESGDSSPEHRTNSHERGINSPERGINSPEQGTGSPERDKTERNEAAPQFGLGDQIAYTQYQKKTNVALWAVFGLLLVLAAAVVFILPRFIGPAEAPSRVVELQARPGNATPAAEISPFEEAQRLRQREAAQNTLAALLESQEALENKQVGRWAGEEFDAALELARQGDEAYREQNFIEADSLYRQGADALQAIVDSEESIYRNLVQRGDEALADGNAGLAEESFSTALLVNPEGEEAVVGLDRSAVLNQVLELLESAGELHAAGELEQAQQLYRQASELDAANQQARDALRQVAADIEQRDYSAAMSRGYAALSQQNPDAAVAAFEQARTLRPDAEEVTTALQQAADQRTNTRINRHMQAARGHEADESWQAALREWQQVLAIDPNLVVAEQGRRRSENRRDLDVFFGTVIREPLRLVDETIYQQTRQLMVDLDQIDNKGPRLREQIARVEQLMAGARVPVTVQLRSDGMTEVSVLRISNLGMFMSESLELLPGEYVALGVREGYRDVRVEFTINIGDEPPTIRVVCSEQI